MDSTATFNQAQTAANAATNAAPGEQGGHRLPPFVPICNQTIDEGHMAAMGGNAFMVYCILRRHAGPKASAWPGYERLRELSRLSRDAIANALDRLEQLGYIKRQQVPNGLGRRNRYWVRKLIPNASAERPRAQQSDENPSDRQTTTRPTVGLEEDQIEEDPASHPPRVRARESKELKKDKRLTSKEFQAPRRGEPSYKTDYSGPKTPETDPNSAGASAPQSEPDPLGRGPWQSRAEMERFERDLEAYGRASGKRSPGGWAKSVMDRLRRGERVTYWEEWANGEQIGECERQPWESAPGQPRSAFVEYLTEHLGYAHETEAQARERAHWVLAQPQRAASHWEAFKHYCQREAERQQQQRDRGVQATDVPRCFKAAYERTSEQAAQESAATLIEHAQASGTLPDSAPAGDALPAQPEPEADPSEGTTTREATEQRDRASDSGLEEPLADTTQRAIDKGVLEGSGLRAAARGLWLRAFRLHWDPQAEHSDRLRAWQLLLDYDATAEWAREHWPEDLPLE